MWPLEKPGVDIRRLRYFVAFCDHGGFSKAVKAMLDGTSGDFATILPHHSVATDAAEGRFAVRMIHDPDMVRTIALLRPGCPEQPLPKLLTEVIFSRAKGIRATLEAVF